MSKRHLIAGCLWSVAWTCVSVAALAQAGPPREVSRDVASAAADLPSPSIAPLPAPADAGQPTMNQTGAPQGPATVTVTTPRHVAGASTITGTPARPPRVQILSLEAGTGKLVMLSAPAASIFAVDPRVAEVRPASPTSLFILGIAPGRTTVAAIGDSGEAIAQYDVVIQPSSYAAMQAQSAIARQLHGGGVRVETRPNGLVVTGSPRTAGEADLALRTAREFAGAGQTVESRLAVLGGQQVNLRVRIAEMSRNVVRQLGINWANLANLGKYAAIGVVTANPLANTTVAASRLAAGYNFNTPGHVLDINAIIDAMAQDQLAHVLAEPNLTAMSGETASFLVGGEFPIPVAQQNNQVTVEFKQYGVSLAFVPTVISGGRINMRVRPEVSALTTQGAVKIGDGNNSIQIPALTVRRAETTVELASGQSFAIAGLLQDTTSATGNALPGIGEVPILGALFRSDSFQRNETELVIVITPYLVNGVSTPAEVRLPTDGFKPPSDLERILLLRQTARAPKPGAAATRIPGDAGFVVR